MWRGSFLVCQVKMRVMSENDNFRAAVVMVLTMACYTLNDTFMKSVSGELPLGQAIFMRGCMVSVLVGVYAWRSGQLRVRIGKSDWWLTGWRVLGEALAAGLFLTAVFNMPLANATAILQIVPLAVTLAGAAFLGEPLGWRRITAILVGFAGVVLIVRPGADGFNVYAICALASVAAVVLRDLATRSLSAKVPSATVALIGAAGVAVLGALMGLGEQWVVPYPGSMLRLLGSALFLLAAYMLTIYVMRIGEIGYVAPFRYTGLIWALILGWLVFGEWPDAITLIGCAIIVGSGVYTVLRGQRVKRQAKGA